LNTDSLFSETAIDSVKSAGLIYITGGNQNVFMQIADRTGLADAIAEAYRKGAMISGTSAGAAVMSRKMITGNQASEEEYTGEFRTIHANNIEIRQGIGLLENAIIDQHFIERMRMNRLISACIENPEEVCIGIDESTAILVKNNVATVWGKSQVIVLRNHDKEIMENNGLLGARDLQLEVFMPGHSFPIQ
jgi:cyanophycinase